MRIKHFLYNAFIIEDGATKIAIDPGINFHIGKLNTLIPKSEWGNVTHILVTHADPDHYWNVDRVARMSNAPIICGKELVRTRGKRKYLPHPRIPGRLYSLNEDRIYGLGVEEFIEIDGVRIRGLRSVHGPVVAKFLHGLIKLRFNSGPGKRVGQGAIGFQIGVRNITVVNLGDSLLQKQWKDLAPDVLMIPIGGRVPENTMDEDEALEAVKLISPKLVIPCHYNSAFLWKTNVNPADDRYFKKEVEKMGIGCEIMGWGDDIKLKAESSKEETEKLEAEKLKAQRKNQVQIEARSRNFLFFFCRTLFGGS